MSRQDFRSLKNPLDHIVLHAIVQRRAILEPDVAEDDQIHQCGQFTGAADFDRNCADGEELDEHGNDHRPRRAFQPQVLDLHGQRAIDRKIAGAFLRPPEPETLRRAAHCLGDRGKIGLGRHVVGVG